jgi:hypothetical protein
MSHWDAVPLFLAAEAAALAIQDDPSEEKALLTRMRNSYESAVAEVVSKNYEVSHPNSLAGTKLVKYFSLDDPLPEGLLYSRALAMYVKQIFRPNPTESSLKSFWDWCRNRSAESFTFSSKFEVQKFDREELHQWFEFHGIESEYDFVQTNDPLAANPGNPDQIDTTTLASPDELLKVFRSWGLRKAWFNSPRNHKWLINARKRVGIGGNSPKPPLYCPYEVMLALAHRIRRGPDAPPRISIGKGWLLLKRSFPEAYEKFKHQDSTDDQRI